MKKTYIIPILRNFWKEFYCGLIQIGICGWALFGLAFLIGNQEWLGWILIGLVFANAVLDTWIATRNTIKKELGKVESTNETT